MQRWHPSTDSSTDRKQREMDIMARGGGVVKKTQVCPLKCILVVKRVKMRCRDSHSSSLWSQPIFLSFILFEYMAHSSHFLLSLSWRAPRFPYNTVAMRGTSGKFLILYSVI